MDFARAIVAAMLCLGAMSSAYAQDAWDTQDANGPERPIPLERQIAQLFSRPLLGIPADASMPIVRVQDASGLVLRIDRLENQLRGLTGQIEQMQFQQRKLEDSLRKFQQDVDLRFQDGGGKPGQRPAQPRRGDGGTPGLSDPGEPGSILPPPARTSRNDAFDPNIQPNAPGAPRPIGSLPQRPGAGASIANPPPDLPYPVGPLDAGDPDDPNAPLDLGKGRPLTQGVVPGGSASVAIPPGQAQLPVAPAPPSQLRDDYDLGVSLIKQAQYESAETSLRAFLQKNPRDRLVPDAVFYVGETLFQRQRYREAAEQFLKLSTDYPKSAKAPDGLVRLGMSLNQLAAKEQACATFGEVARKYPAASTSVRHAAQESKRAGC